MTILYCVGIIIKYIINIDRRHGEIMDETHVLQLIKNEHMMCTKTY